MQKGYRIISVEAADIYKYEQEYGVAVGYKLPELKSDAYFWLFKNKLDYSLDSIELEKAYARICRKKFSFVDEHNNSYTLAVVGVIAATIITNLTICHIVEPYVLYKHTLKTSVKPYYARNYLYIALFVGLLFALHFCMVSKDNQWAELFANGGISLAFSLIISVIIAICNKDFRHYMKKLLQKFSRKKNDNIIVADDNESNNIVTQSEECDEDSMLN